MSFAKRFLGKELEQIEAADILRFFKQNRSEGHHLEFKSGEVHMDKILKEVCAFLNTEGGLLIVGAPREMSIPGMAEHRSSFGEPVPSEIRDPEVFAGQMLKGIEPAPVGVKLHQVRFSSGSVFLLDIPRSDHPPHQVRATGKYYLRERDMSRPARHSELEKMFLESRKAVLDLQIELERPADAVLVRLIFENKSTASAEEPAFAFEAFPVRQSYKHQEQRIFKDNYLARGQRWVQEIEVLPRDPHFFIACQYYSKNVDVKLKAAFAEIQHKKIQILEVFNSEVHSDFQLWYNQNSHLLNS